MQWFKPSLRSSFYGLLGHSGPPTDSVLDAGIEDIRERMLDLLGDDGARRYPQITRRIRYAADVQGLWYLRGDLMGVVASVEGEAVARLRLRKVSEMFQGLLPGSLASRPSPLVD